MKPWHHLIESDEKFRAAQRAWQDNPSEENLDEYIRMARRYGERELADTMEATQLLSNRTAKMFWNRPDAIDLKLITDHFSLAQIRTMLDAPNVNRVNALFYNGVGEVYHGNLTMASGAPQTWRVTGQLKVWKTRPTEFRIPIKYGMYTNYNSGYITHDNANEFYRDERDARNHN